jgi:hypothetical protein
MRTFINLLVVVSLLSLTGCIPGLFGGTGGQVSVQYGSSSGDTTGFVLTPFDTSQVTANRFDTTTLVAIQANQDVLHTMLFTLQGQLAPGFTCTLKQGSFGGGGSADGCTLAYQQSASDGSNAQQGSVTSGAVTVTAYDGPSLSFSFEATLQTLAGGSFTLQGSGSTSIQSH